MIYQNKSCKKLLFRLKSTLQLQGSDWVNYAIEWIGDGVKLIGQFPMLSDTMKDVTVKNHRAPLPCDFYLLKSPGVYYNGTPVPYSGGKHGLNLHCSDCEITLNIQNHYYDINPGYLIFSEEETDAGELCISYKAMPTDDEGLPMIADNVEVETALFWYVMSQLLLSPAHKHSEISFKYADEKWEFHRMRASNDVKMPNGDEMERLSNVWKNLIDRGDYWSTSFADLGDPEYIDRFNINRQDIDY